jgi:site-specific DNA recombinase
MTEQVRAAGYVRVSTEDQKENGWNLSEDRARIEQIVSERGWQLVAIYDDGGRHGDDPDRPGLLAMLAAAKDREFDVLIVRSQDR